MTKPIAIHPSRQYSDGDCSLAALAMLSGRPYASVRATVNALYPKAKDEGVTPRQLLRISRALKFPLRQRVLHDTLSEDLDDATGLLVVAKRIGRRWHGHAVVLFDGVVLDPSDGLLWNLDAYLAESAWTLDYLLEPTT